MYKSTVYTYFIFFSPIYQQFQKYQTEPQLQSVLETLLLNKRRLPEPHLKRQKFVFADIFVLKYNIVLNPTNINEQDTV